MKIVVVGDETGVDFASVKAEFEKASHQVITKDLNDDFSDVDLSDSLVILMHDYTIGRGEPDVAKAHAKYLNQKLGREIDGIVVLRPDGATGNETLLMSFVYSPTGIKENRVTPLFVDRQTFAADKKQSFFKKLEEWWNARPKSTQQKTQVQPTGMIEPKREPVFQSDPVTRPAPSSYSVTEVLTAVEFVNNKKQLIKACDSLLKKVTFHRERVKALREAIKNAKSLDELSGLIQDQLKLFNPDQKTRSDHKFTSLFAPLRRKMQISWGYHGMLKACEKLLNAVPQELGELTTSVTETLRPPR